MKKNAKIATKPNACNGYIQRTSSTGKNPGNHMINPVTIIMIPAATTVKKNSF
jgi:hypothetical protein